MRFASNNPLRSPSRHAVRAGLEAAPGANEDLSVTWKGWTNGGGERASTAAQFSRFGDSLPNTTAANFGLPSQTAVRVQTAAPTSAPHIVRMPADPAAATAPISAAIERLIVRGQDNLSVTVRFEQGGSLSLKLALRDGEIATNIQTDVPGLEGALRSAWGQFAQDWQGRGVKLGQPSFAGSLAQQQDASEQGGRQPARERFDAPAESSTGFRSSGFGDPRRRAVRTATATTTLSTSSTADRGLKTWA